MPTGLSCMGICSGCLARNVYMTVPNKLCACVCATLLFSWWVAGLSRTSWPAVQGTTVPSDPRPVGNPGQRWHGHKSTDTEHVEAFRRQTHHLLPAGTPPSSSAVPLLSVKSKIAPMEIEKNTDTHFFHIGDLKQRVQIVGVSQCFFWLIYTHFSLMFQCCIKNYHPLSPTVKL